MNGLIFRFAQWCPGALGLWLRQKLFPRFFRSCGRGVLFGRFVAFIAPEKISLGNRVVLNNGVILDAGRSRSNPAIILEDNVFIGTGTVLWVGEQGTLEIKAGANFSSFCSVRTEFPLFVGRNCLVAAYSELGDFPEDGEVMDQAGPGQERASGRTGIEDGCWLGVRMRVQSGVTIGRDTIVGAHAVVGSNLPAQVVAVGRPAVVIRNR